MTESSSQPSWRPDLERYSNANITRFLQLVSLELDPHVHDYHGLHEFSLRHPRQFWELVWEFTGIIGERGGHEVARNLDQMPGTEWFPNSSLNFAENLLRHRDDRPALVFENEAGDVAEISYAELYLRVAGVASALKAQGIAEGDRVAGYLPNIPETIIAMLATTSLGAVWSSCSPDFGVGAVVDRLGQIRPKVLFTAAAYSYNGKIFDCLDKVQEISAQIPSLERIVVTPFMADDMDLSEIGGAVAWDDFVDPDATEVGFNRLPFDHPVYILYSSGTTGKPKCIVHGAGGTLIQHAKELVLHTDLKRDDAIFYFTTCGWMMWNWLVSSLTVGAKVMLFDGSPFHPGPERMFDFIDRHGITHFGTSARGIAAWQNEGLVPGDSHDLGSLKTILSTGSPLLPEQFDWVYDNIKQDLQLSSISGGTDIVSCFALGCPILPVWRGELQCRGLGMAVEIRRDDGTVAEVGETGELACSQPFPAMPVGFWNDPEDERFHDAYFDKINGVWTHGDFAKITDNGGLVIFGRSDATLNPGGVRIGTAEIYRQLEGIDEVLEGLCIGQEWQGDTRVVLFVKLREDAELTDELIQHIRSTIRAGTSPRHVPAKVIAVPDLPRTLSGKLVELAVREIVHGREVKNRDALANPGSLDHFRDRSELQS